MRLWARLLLVALLSAALLPAQDAELAKLRRKLAGKDDPGSRAKITVKIGNRLLDQLQRHYQKGNTTEGEETLAEYMTAIEAAHQGLMQSGRDARKKPKGFKHLEVHLRRSARRLQDVAYSLPSNERGTLQAALEKVEGLRLELLAAVMKVDIPPEGEQDDKEKQP